MRRSKSVSEKWLAFAAEGTRRAHHQPHLRAHLRLAVNHPTAVGCKWVVGIAPIRPTVPRPTAVGRKAHTQRKAFQTRSKVKPVEFALDKMLEEASWRLSHAEALADYGREEGAAAELARAAGCEEQVSEETGSGQTGLVIV